MVLDGSCSLQYTLSLQEKNRTTQASMFLQSQSRVTGTTTRVGQQHFNMNLQTISLSMI